jgi:hypothetical protein
VPGSLLPDTLPVTINKSSIHLNSQNIPTCCELFSFSFDKQVKSNPHYRPGQALRVPGGWGFHISRQSAREGGKAVSPTHRPPLSSRKYSWYSFLLEAESTTGPQCGRKDYVNEKLQWTPSGIEPTTFRLVAQCLNQLLYRVPHYQL